MATAMVPLFGAFIVLPQFARYTLGLEPLWVGALLLPGGLLMGLAGPTVGRLYDRFGPRPLVIPGAIGLSVSIWTLAFGLGEGSSWVVLLGAHIVLMLSLAFLFTPAFSTLARLAAAAALLARQRDRSPRCSRWPAPPGRPIFVALYATGLAASGNVDPELPSAAEAANGAHLAFVAGGILSLVVIGLALFIRKAPVSRARRAPRRSRTDPSHETGRLRTTNREDGRRPRDRGAHGGQPRWLPVALDSGHSVGGGRVPTA